MEDADGDVLEFIGDQGKTAEQVADRFQAFDARLFEEDYDRLCELLA
jgi:hypothetical protein